LAKKTIAELQVKTSGAQKASKDLERVGKSTESVGRAQTRLGQASASAGRSFSAQAQGLGGLVGVYAAAAANVFAITAAFEALGRAAQAEQIVRGTKTLALEIGAAGQTVLDSVQSITQGQLTVEEAAQNINIALSAGFNTEQIERLSEVSLKASRALGRNLTDAFQRVVRGAAKLEPELLDELGIFTRIDPAVESYANKIGVAASSLTNFEKRQAFVNAVLEEGEKKFGSIDTTLDTTQKKFEQLRVQLIELAIEFGQLTANVLSPLVDFFNNNLGAALLLFGGILSLVFGRAVQAVGGFVSKSIGKLSSLADFIADKAKFPLDRLTDLQKGINQPLAQGGLTGIRTAPVIGQDPAQAARFKEALEAQRSGAVSTASQLNKVNRAYKEQARLIEATGRTGTKSFAALTAAIAANNAALATGGARVLLFTKASNLLTIAVRGAAVAFSFLATAINFLFIGLAVAQLVGTLFDVDILAKIKGLFVDLSQASAELKAGLAGAVEASGRESIADFLLRIGASKEVLEDIPDLIKDINTELRNFRGEQTAAANAAAIAAGEIQKFPGSLTGSAITNQFKELSLLKQREFRLKGLLAIEKSKKDQDELRIGLLERLIEANNRFGQSETLLAGAADFLGLSTAEVLRLTEDSITVNKELDQTVIRFLPNVNLLGKRFSDLKKEEQDIIASGTLLLKVFDDAEKSFNRGAASSETLSKKIFGLRQAIDDVRSTGGVVSKQDENRLKRLVKQQAKLKELEIIGKALVDTYGKYGQTLDKAVQTGLISDGKIAETAEEQAKNQAEFLALQAGILSGSRKQLEIAVAQGIAEKDRNANQIQLLINSERARKDILGLAFSTLQALEKEILGRQKVLTSLKEQLELQKEQQKLQDLRAEQALQQEQFSQRIAQAQLELDLQTKGLEIAKNSAQEAQRAGEQRTKNLTSELDLLQKIQGIRASIAARAAARGQTERQAGIRAAEARLEGLEAFPNLSGQGAILTARKELADLILKNELETLKERERVAAQDAADQLAVLSKRLEINSQETENTNSAISREEATRLAELSILKTRQRLDGLRANAEAFQIQARRDLAARERIIAQLNIKAQEKKFQLDNLQFQRQTEGIKAQAEVVNTLVAILNDKNNAFVKSVEALTDGPIDFKETVGEVNLKLGDLDKIQTQVETVQAGIISSTEQAANKTLNSSMMLFDAQDKGLSDQRQAQRELARLEENRITKEANNKIAALKDERDLLREKASLLGIEITQIEQAYALRIEQINKDRDAAIAANKAVSDANARAQDRLRAAGDAITKSIQTNLVDGFLELNNALIEGTLTLSNFTDGLRSFVTNLVREIQRIFFTKTIAEPAAEFLAKGFASGFSEIFGANSTGVDTGPIGFEGTDMSGAVTSAAGGLVHMAAGGMLRDRVPALLEPGEFVVRKAAAKAAGGPALSALNATGQMAGPVSVNIQNEGTPKDAEASAPRFDGEKFVVDIVLRDLSNNGPIRKSLRAGA
jgi:hypothetical protein